MELELVATLAVLALIDSTSFGTLGIPVWFLIVPEKVRLGRLVVFLATVAVVYLALGLAILSGLAALQDALDVALEARPVRLAQLALGAVLLLLGVTIEPWTKAGKARRAERRAQRGPGRLQRWRRRVTSGDTSTRGLVVLALAATGIEAASMVPYLAALGLLSTTELGLARSGGVLAVYCLVMITPALVLAAARITLHERIAPVLERIDAWLTRNAREVTAWVLALAGLWLLSSAASALSG